VTVDLDALGARPEMVAAIAARLGPHAPAGGRVSDGEMRQL
jgi:hypothetical protein